MAMKTLSPLGVHGLQGRRALFGSACHGFPGSTRRHSSKAQKTHAGARPMHEIPGPPVIPILGTAYKFFPGGEYNMAALTQSSRIRYRKYGPIVREKMGPRDWVFLYTPEDVETVYKNEGDYPDRGETTPVMKVYREMRNIPPSVAGLDGPEWQALRSPLQKLLLRPDLVASYTAGFTQVADDCVALLRGLRDSDLEVADTLAQLQSWSAESIGLVCFDARLGMLSRDLEAGSPEQEFLVTFRRQRVGLCRAIMLWPFYKHLPYQTYGQFIKDCDVVFNTARRHIEAALQREQRGEAGPLGHQQSVLLQLLHHSGLSHDQAMSQAMEVFNGGVDSTSNTATFLLYCLATNPDKQERLYEEMRAHVTDPARPLEYRHLEGMRYLWACLKESLRVFPPTPFGTPRVVQNDVILSGYLVPKGTYCILDSCLMGHREDYFRHPERFLPERWLRGGPGADPDQVPACPAKKLPFLQFPFGRGRRMCLGKKIAETEIAILVVRILSNFRLEYHHEPVQVKNNLFNAPTKPLKLRFLDRT